MLVFSSDDDTKRPQTEIRFGMPRMVSLAGGRTAVTAAGGSVSAFLAPDAAL